MSAMVIVVPPEICAGPERLSNGAHWRTLQPPVDPEPSRWAFPPSHEWDHHDLIAVGADLDPSTVLAGYRAGLFPMNIDRRRLGWWSPSRRGLLEPGSLAVTRSMRRSQRRYTTTIDVAFDRVIVACAKARTTGNWINAAFIDTYVTLHHMGWTHSVEVWDGDSGGPLVGGLYGVHLDGLFAGESMFHLAPDASKVALMRLVDHLDSRSIALLDTQWLTPHLATLGVTEIARDDYLRRLATALATPRTWTD
jgi:leucyl/phenylalanyl-tRNA---protein transferase